MKDERVGGSTFANVVAREVVSRDLSGGDRPKQPALSVLHETQAPTFTCASDLAPLGFELISKLAVCFVPTDGVGTRKDKGGWCLKQLFGAIGE